jgi:hypothetical protein
MITAVNLLSIPTSLPRSHLPASLSAAVRPSRSMPNAAAFPTHVLAVSSTGAPSSPTTPTVASFAAQMASGSSGCALYPTHSLVLAAHCVKLPSLPASRSSGPSNSALALPVVPLSVPDVASFAHLHTFLHTKRADILLAALLPTLQASLPRASAASGSTHRNYTAQFTSENLLRLAQALASTAFAQGGSHGAMQTIMAHVKGVSNLWKNTCSLGVFDTELWAVIDLAYEICLTALNCIARQ